MAKKKNPQTRSLRALENLTPATRIETILNGDEISPATREEYFLKKAVSGGGGGSSLPIINVSYTLVMEPPNPPVDVYEVTTDVSTVESIIESGKICLVIITDISNESERELYMSNDGIGLSSVSTPGLSETGVVLEINQISVEDGIASFYTHLVDVARNIQ